MAVHPDRDILIKYLDDNLDHDHNRNIEVHVETCLECRELLRQLAEGSCVLESPTIPDARPKTGQESKEAFPPVSGYRLTSVLGEGGMGIVYRGRDVQLGRHVAVKVLKSAFSERPAMRRRFLEEAQVTSQLGHPGIPPVHLLGTLEDGRPYFVMKVVEGQTLAELLAARVGPPGDLTRFLPLFGRVVEALAYAHSKGVIHRDLKPSNVMVGTFGEVLVMDWGLAKVLSNQDSDGEGTDGSADAKGLETERTSDRDKWTRAGSALGTWAYMPPEQARGEVARIDRRSDVFGLGAILCELLTGQTPYGDDSDGYRNLALSAHLEPARHRLASCGADTALTALATSCLAEEPDARPADAAVVAAKFASYVAGVEERLRRVEQERLAAEAQIRADEARAALERRSRQTVVTLIASAVLVLVVVLATAAGLLLAKNSDLSYALLDVAAAEQSAREEAVKAREAEARATEKEAGEREARKAARRESERAEKELHRAEQLVYGDQIDRAMSFWRDGDAKSAANARDACRWDLRGWEHQYLHTLLDHSHVVLKGHTGAVASLDFSPDGTLLVSGSEDRTVRIWNTRTGQETLRLAGHVSGVTSVVYSPDGTRIASGSQDRTVRIWDARTGHSILELRGHTATIRSVAFSPDGTRIASATGDSQVRDEPAELWVWDLGTEKRSLQLQGHTRLVTSVSFSPDGTQIVSGSHDTTVRLWDAATGQSTRTLKGHTHWVRSVCHSPDGSRISSASHDGSVGVWDASTGHQIRSLPGHTASFHATCFSPDGARIASSARDSTVRLWDARTGQQTRTLHGHTQAVNSADFSPDGTRLATASADQTVRIWDVRTGQEALILQGHTSAINSVAFSPDGARLASASTDQTMRVWDAQSGQQLLRSSELSGTLFSLRFGHDGKHIVGGSEDRRLHVWNALTGEGIRQFHGHTQEVVSVDISPDGTRILSASRDRTLRIWDVRTGRQILQIPGHGEQVSSVRYSPDGTRIVSGSRDQTARVWDAQTGQEILQLRGHTQAVRAVAFNPDGTRIATASGDRTVRVWDARTGHQLLLLPGHWGPVTSVSFSPDGSRIASGSYDQRIRLWEAQTGQLALVLQGHTSFINCLCFSPDGTRIASGSSDQTIRIWDARVRQDSLPLEGQANAVHSVGFSADGQRILATEQGGAVRSWNAFTGREILTQADVAPPSQTVALSPDGQRLVRIEGGSVRVEPMTRNPRDDSVQRRMSDPLMDVPFRLECARQAVRDRDDFALRFHLRPLVLQSIVGTTARPHETFPLWVQRPPILRVGDRSPPNAVALTPNQLASLDAELSGLTRSDGGWEAWVGRAWIRHLRGEPENAIEDLHNAISLRPTEPMPWAMLGTIALSHGRIQVAEEARAKLAAWPGLLVAAWHMAEADTFLAEGATVHALWHLNHLVAKAPTPELLVRIGRLHLKEGREKEAFAAFAQAVAHERVNPEALFWHARACASTGDTTGYRHACETLAQEVPADLRRVAFLRPAALTNYDVVLKQFPETDRSVARAGLLFRSGKPREAAMMLRQALVNSRLNGITRFLLLALAEHQLGNRPAARQALIEAKHHLMERPLRIALLQLGPGGGWGTLSATTATFPSSWTEQLEIRLLLAEAEAAVAGP